MRIAIPLFLTLAMSCADDHDHADSDDEASDVTGDDDDDDDDNGTNNGGTTDGSLEGWCTGQDENFSFFVTSMSGLWALSDSADGDMDGGFGGDFGGLAGADQICQQLATATGHGDKTWRAFLSVTDDGSGQQVDAIDRIGSGPWYDANGRLVADDLAGLSGERPDGEAQSVDDLPDECGVPLSALGDAHDIVTGSDENGRLYSSDPDTTCNNWTSSDGSVGGSGDLMCGHSFPREGGPGGGGPGGGPGGDEGANWVSDHSLHGCGKGANLIQDGPGSGSCIGCGGGYGAFYCFAE